MGTRRASMAWFRTSTAYPFTSVAPVLTTPLSPVKAPLALREGCLDDAAPDAAPDRAVEAAAGEGLLREAARVLLLPLRLLLLLSVGGDVVVLAEGRTAADIEATAWDADLTAPAAAPAA